MATTEEALESHIKRLQAERQNQNGNREETSGVAFGKAIETDLYGDDSGRAGYVTSIAPNEQDEDEGDTSLSTGKLSFTAPAHIYNELRHEGENIDPMAQYKRPTIADRNNEYRAKRMAMMISPARQDPFAGGGCFGLCHVTLFLSDK